MIKYLQNEQEFSEVLNQKRVLLDFYADWCGPCQRMGVVLETLDNIEIIKINTDDYPEIAKNYGIMSIPTLILMENGNVVRKLIGLQSREDLEKFIQED